MSDIDLIRALAPLEASIFLDPMDGEYYVVAAGYGQDWLNYLEDIDLADRDEPGYHDLPDRPWIAKRLVTVTV